MQEIRWFSSSNYAYRSSLTNLSVQRSNTENWKPIVFPKTWWNGALHAPFWNLGSFLNVLATTAGSTFARDLCTRRLSEHTLRPFGAPDYRKNTRHFHAMPTLDSNVRFYWYFPERHLFCWTTWCANVRPVVFFRSCLICTGSRPAWQWRMKNLRFWLVGLHAPQ